jgi:hypothetical protein
MPSPDSWIEAKSEVLPEQPFMVVSPAMATRLKLKHEAEARVNRVVPKDASASRTGFSTTRTTVYWEFPLEHPASLVSDSRAIIDEMAHPEIDVVISAEELKHGSFKIDKERGTWEFECEGWPEQLNWIHKPPPMSQSASGSG